VSVGARLLEDSAQELFEDAPCGYLTTRLDGTIVKVNRTFETWTGRAREDLLDRVRFQELLSAGGRIYHETHYAPLLRMQGSVREIAVDIIRADGTLLPALINSVLRVDDDGRPRVIRTTVFDATDRRRYEEELRVASDIRAAAIDEAESDALFEEWLSTVGEGVAGYVTPKCAVAAVVGGCNGCSTPLGAQLAGLQGPSGTMPHAMILIFGDTVTAAQAFDKHMGPDVLRIVLVDTFKDEAEEALRVAGAMQDRLRGVRLDTPFERGRVTVELVKGVRARLDLAGFPKVGIFVSGGMTVERIRAFVEAKAPVDSFGVGMEIAAAPPIGFTADIKEVDGEPRTKRGRIPGVTEAPRLQRVI